MTRLLLLVVFFSSALVVFSGSGNSICLAAIVIYNESTQGDFPAFPQPLPTNPLPDFVLPPVVSMVQGAMAEPATPADMEDWFVFEVPENMRLENAEFDFDTSRLPPLFERLPDVRYRLYLLDEEAERLVLDFTIPGERPRGGSVGALTLEGGVPLADGLDEGVYGMRFNVNEPAPNGVPYVVTFIPEPASAFLLIGSSLFTLVPRRRPFPPMQSE